jgi:hypothetical protein
MKPSWYTTEPLASVVRATRSSLLLLHSANPLDGKLIAVNEIEAISKVICIPRRIRYLEV